MYNLCDHHDIHVIYTCVLNHGDHSLKGKIKYLTEVLSRSWKQSLDILFYAAVIYECLVDNNKNNSTGWQYKIPHFYRVTLGRGRTLPLWDLWPYPPRSILWKYPSNENLSSAFPFCMTSCRATTESVCNPRNRNNIPVSISTAIWWSPSN